MQLINVPRQLWACVGGRNELGAQEIDRAVAGAFDLLTRILRPVEGGAYG
jgi:hypothetical protein